jgi:hypothetical protein
MVRSLVALFAAVLLFPGAAFSAQPVDLQLIIAVDVSRSVDAVEGQLQRQGYVQAFSNDEVIEAIQAGFNGRIAVLYFEWASADYQKLVQDWTVIDGPETSKAFAARLAAEAPSSERRTAISSAIDWAVPRFSEGPFDAKRKVIDISGDGPNNFSRPVATARDAAVAAGVTINGLPIVNRSAYGYGGFGGLARAEDLAPYYEQCVIGGRDSFIVVANGFEDFANAIHQKLVLEISDITPETAPEGVKEKLALSAPRGVTRPLGDNPLLARVQEEGRTVSCDNTFGGYGGYDGYYRFGYPD